jgi:uncharacterized membrane protein YhaH (DUF805 family)
VDWMILPFMRYADFSGRSRRKEYWLFVLFNILVVISLLIVSGFLGMLSDDKDVGVGSVVLLLVVYSLATIVPSFAVQIRRLHDQDKSGWFVLLGLVPFGGIVLLIFMLIEGTPGPNRYGPDPKAEDPRPLQPAPAQATALFCSSCGSKVPTGAHYCMGCGKPIASHT